MNVVIDIGNTRIKWARADGLRIEAPGQAPHRDAAASALDALIAALPAQVDAVAVANVAGETIGRELAERVRAACGVEPRLFDATSGAGGVEVAYDEPARLGADRFAAMVAAHHWYPGPVCVVDAGTTVTFDAVDAEGQHLGGLILAGPALVVDALNRHTQRVRAAISIGEPPRGLDVLGKSTDAAVGYGAMLALAGAIDRAVESVADALGLEPTVVLTGGDGRGLEPWLRTAVEYREDLVLEGLAWLLSQGGINDHA